MPQASRTHNFLFTNRKVCVMLTKYDLAVAQVLEDSDRTLAAGD